MSSPFVILNSRVRFDGNCETTRSFCGAVCCKNTIVLLNKEETESGQYEYHEPKDSCTCQTCNLMRQTGLRALSRNDNGCIYLDGVGKCSIYESRPQRCRDFACDKNWWNLQLASKPREASQL